jgi:hypothetical protein
MNKRCESMPKARQTDPMLKFFLKRNILQMRADIDLLKEEKAKQSAVFKNRKEQFSNLLAVVKELQTSITNERESTVSIPGDI